MARPLVALAAVVGLAVSALAEPPPFERAFPEAMTQAGAQFLQGKPILEPEGLKAFENKPEHQAKLDDFYYLLGKAVFVQMGRASAEKPDVYASMVRLVAEQFRVDPEACLTAYKDRVRTADAEEPTVEEEAMRAELLAEVLAAPKLDGALAARVGGSLREAGKALLSGSRRSAAGSSSSPGDAVPASADETAAASPASAPAAAAAPAQAAAASAAKAAPVKSASARAAPESASAPAEPPPKKAGLKTQPAPAPKTAEAPSAAEPTPPAARGWSWRDLIDWEKAVELAREVKEAVVGFTKYCYRFVKNALERAGLMARGWRAKVSSEEAVSAYQFSRLVREKPYLFKRKLREISPYTKPLPVGSILVWGKGDCGFSREHGHIEIVVDAKDPPLACSDGCARVNPKRWEHAIARTGCMKVFVPSRAAEVAAQAKYTGGH
ncbi:MAG: hypothetical protein WC969_01380 [Elusimicrobiota bacterium]|jgi:hypothetical protein